MSEEKIAQHRRIWARKPSLRAVYASYHRKITDNCHKYGITLEIGSGSGHFSSPGMTIFQMDILKIAEVDLVGDATVMPFASNSIDNIVMIDVLHHLGDIPSFFNDAARILKDNGRIIMIEPGITFLSRIFYKLFHSEPVIMQANPLRDKPWNNKQAFDGNQAIPTLLIGRDRNIFKEDFPFFIIKKDCFFDIIPYPLSGGFKSWSLLPNFAVESILKLDSIISSIFGNIFGFRVLIVIELNNEKT